MPRSDPQPPSIGDSNDRTVCLCFHVSERKIVNYCRRERPPVASLISECLSAGTGCGWCVPFLKQLHRQVEDGVEKPGLTIDPQRYAAARSTYRKTGQRDPSATTCDADENADTPDPASETPDA